jgi:hypothetical protein
MRLAGYEQTNGCRLQAKNKQMDKDQMEQRSDGTTGQTAISCTDRKLPSPSPELRLTGS